MPVKEEYGAQPPIEILRQFLDQKGWFDLKEAKHPFKNIIETTLIAAMGPPGGGKSFITPRMQRHFSVISFVDCDDSILRKIFTTILDWYFGRAEFNGDVERMKDKIVEGTMKIYHSIQEDLKPTPAKSHYTFNLRDFSKVIMGICMAGPSQVPTDETMIRLWTHETIRVFGDRLINDDDRMWMLTACQETCRSAFGQSFDSVFRHLDIDNNGKIETLDEIRGLAFGDVITPVGMPERPYEEIQDREELKKACELALN